MSTRGAARLAWVLWALSVAFTVLGLVLFALNRSTPVETGLGSRSVDATVAVILLAFPTVGALIASRRPENAIGWLFCVAGASLELTILASEYAIYALLTSPSTLPLGEWAAWLTDWLLLPVLLLGVPLLLLLFPNGRFASPRWRTVAWLAGAGAVTASVAIALAPGPLEEPFRGINNPLGIEAAGGILDVVGGIGWFSLVISFPASALSLVIRFRRAKGEERQQLKWIAAAAALLAVVWVSQTVAYETSSTIGLTMTAVMGATALVALPLATGIAILRYRLYDIDRIINRTLVYGLLTGALGLTYFGLVIGLQAALRPFTGGSDVAIALTTLVVAALFLPARRRIQDAVDHRFNRRRYDAARTLAAFSARLRDEVDMETLQGDLIAVVNETVQPAHISLWLRPSEARR